MARVRRKMHAAVTTGSAKDIPAFPARLFDGLYALSLGTGSIAPIAGTTRVRCRRLGASTGAPGPRDFTVRIGLFVGVNSRCKPLRQPHPTSRVVTVAKRPSCRGGTSERIVVICPTRQAPTPAT
jgi:hypothetical protein